MEKKYRVTIEGQSYEVVVEAIEAEPSETTLAPRTLIKASATPPAAISRPQSIAHAGREAIEAPLPGKIIKIYKSAGEEVKAGEVVMILEAMKMENDITATLDGTLTDVRVAESSIVKARDILFTIN